MEDIRIMRKTVASSYIAAKVAGTAQIVSRNEKRVALIVSNLPGAPATNLSMDPNMAAGQGMVLSNQFPGIVLNIHDHGAMCYGPWYSTGGAGTFLSVTETLLSDE